MNEITPANGALLSFIERAAKDPEFDVAKFGELLRLQRDVGHDQARRAFNAAMAEAQSEMLPVARSAENKHLGNKYAKLEDIDREMRPIYTRHGFSVRFGSAPPPAEGFIRITCTVAHDGGYFEENYLDSPITTTGSQGGRMATTPVQAVGSAVTYLRRYLLGMVFNIVLANEDDDGEGSRRAAATATPRGARIAERAPTYEAPPPKKVDRSQWTDAQWQAWVEKFGPAVAVLYSRQDVVDVAEKDSVKDALQYGSERVREEVSKILSDGYKRFPDDGTEAHEPATEDVV